MGSDSMMSRCWKNRPWVMPTYRCWGQPCDRPTTQSHQLEGRSLPVPIALHHEGDRFDNRLDPNARRHALPIESRELDRLEGSRSAERAMIPLNRILKGSKW